MSYKKIKSFTKAIKPFRSSRELSSSKQQDLEQYFVLQRGAFEVILTATVAELQSEHNSL